MRRSSAFLAVLGATILLLVLAACNSTTKSGSLTGVMSADGWDEDFEVRLGIPPAEPPDFGKDPQISIEAAENKGEFQLIADGDDTRAVFATVLYNQEVCHFVGVFGGDSGKSLFIAVETEPGVIDLGWIIPQPDKKSGLSGKVPLITLKFVPGASEAVKKISAAPIGNQHAVDNLECEWNDTGLVVTFFERNPGDYDRSGEVGIPDITPIALNYQAVVSDYIDNPLAVIDGDKNGEIGIPDLTVIAQNYLTIIAGFTFQFSADGGGSWIPADPASIHFEDAFGFTRNSAEVVIEQSKAFPLWTITIPAEVVSSLGIPGFDPTNNGLMARVLPSDGAVIGIASNEADIVIAGGEDTEPPVWDSTIGVVSVTPVANTNALTVSFGKATDDSGNTVQYRIYYAKTADFSIEAVTENPLGNEVIRVKYAEFGSLESPPYSVTLKGLVPGENYTVLVRAFDKAFPVQNFEENEVTLGAIASANGLLLGDINVLTFDGVPYPGNPESGDTILFDVSVAGGDGSYTATWSDKRPNTGYFFRETVENVGGADYAATAHWGTASGDEWYLIEISVTDGTGRVGLQERPIRVNRGATTNFNTQIWPMVEAKCSTCHVAPSIGGLDLSNEYAAYANLVNVNSSALPAKKRVKPFDPKNSYLICTLFENCDERVGGRMPPGETPLSQAELAGVLRWILTGALQGASPNQIILGEPSLSAMNNQSGNFEPVEQIPAGAFGQIEIPVLSPVTLPISISVVSEAGAHGDVWFDLDGFFQDNSIVIFAGGDAAASFPVTVEVEDSAGKSGSSIAEVIITETGSEPYILSYASDIEPLLLPKCATCHSGIQPVLLAGSGFASLVNAGSSVSGWDYAEPGFPSKSYLINKLLGWPPVPESSAPHHINPDIEEDMDFVMKTAMWIYGGAKP